MALTKKQRAELRMKFGGRCAYCGCELPEKGWHADHVQPVARISEQDMKAAEKGIFKLKATGEVRNIYADTLENQFPACARWKCSENKSRYRLSGGEIAVSISAPQSASASLKSLKSLLCSGSKSIRQKEPTNDQI